MRKLPLSFLFLGFLAFCAGQSPSAFAAEHGAKSNGEKSEGSKKEDDNISGGRFEGDPVYVRIVPLTLPIISSNGVEQIVSLIITVHMKDLEKANLLHKNMPRAVDSLLRHLYGGLDEGTLRNGKIVNIPKIKRKAKAAIEEIIGKGTVEEVLVEGVSQRML
ncbi:MAG: hypothetical protein WC464_07220 [Bdellovibrionales bacterium]